jgi:hypothetical protein
MARLELCIGSATALAAIALFACGDEQPMDVGDNSGGNGTTTTSDTTGNNPMTTASVTTTATTGGMSTFDCDPAAAPGSIYELEDDMMFPPKDVISMCQYRGEVMLIFNAAAI